MLKIKIITICLFSAIILQANTGIVIKGLTLKYVLFQTAADIYLANIQKPDYFNRDKFDKISKYGGTYYDWLVSTYNNFPAENKQELKNIFSIYHEYYLMSLVTNLDDSVHIEDIVKYLVNSNKVKKSLYSDISIFFPYYYNNYLKTLIQNSDSSVNSLVIKFQNELNSNKIDIFEFMEQQSGCKFKIKYKAEFYFTLSILSAYGFVKNDIKISTLQRSNNNLQKVLSTAFHEYSHELFKSFVSNKKFKKYSVNLKNNTKFKEMWDNNFTKSYDWIGWCEENLVNGFSEYLSYKYFGQFTKKGNYYYDYQFYEYLKTIPFDPQTSSLYQVCLDFMEKQINK